MGKSPAVLFYTSDFISGTAFMNFKQRGMYITLLCLQHQQGHLREEDMIELCGGRDEKVFEKFIIDEDGLYYNERMEIEFQKRIKYSESRKQNIQKRYERQEHMNYICSTYVEHMENENENENINISEDLIVQSNNISTNLGDEPQSASNAPKNEGQSPSKEEQAPRLAPLEERFSRFWEAYPRKRAKDDAKRRWMSLKPSEALLEVMLAAIDEQNKSAEWKKEGGKFIPYPATWLNRGQWNDELTPQGESAAPGVPKYSNFGADEAFTKALMRSGMSEEKARRTCDEYK